MAQLLLQGQRRPDREVSTTTSHPVPPTKELLQELVPQAGLAQVAAILDKHLQVVLQQRYASGSGALV